MRGLSEPTASQVAGESQSECSSSRVTIDTLVPRGQPEIAGGLESQIEPWLPLMQHKSAVHCGIGSAVICHRLIDNDLQPPPVSDNQCRGAGCQKNSLAARSGEVFSLDIPFHRTFRFVFSKMNAELQQHLPRSSRRLIRDFTAFVRGVVIVDDFDFEASLTHRRHPPSLRSLRSPN